MSKLDSAGNETDADAMQRVLPYLTADLPGIGGKIKQEPEDFVVEEIPAYEPCGDGEHLFLWVEKRDISAEQLIRQVARALEMPDRDIGVAGMKDRRAVTRQYVSVPAKLADRVPAIESDSIRILSSTRHTNKLRTGHLRGNRFTILVRDVADGAINIATQILERIARRGFPNYYGEQRFGHEGETLRTGFDLLLGNRSKSDLPRSRARFLLRLSISAVQSHLFNQALASRIQGNIADRVFAGDVMQVVASGGLFMVENIDMEQSRCGAGETAITGPMFGPKMRRPQGEPGEWESRLLESHTLNIEDFARFAKLAEGTRRPYQVRPQELTVAQEPAGLKFQFVLPSGVYATTLLREFQKSDATG